MKLDSTIATEQAIAKLLLDIEKEGSPVPTSATISTYDFAETVRRLLAKVEYNETTRESWFTMHTTSGTVRVFGNDFVPAGEVLFAKKQLLAVGDVVRLRTGGPLMTVEALGAPFVHGVPGAGLMSQAAIELQDEEEKKRARIWKVWCVWFVEHAPSQTWTGPYREAFAEDAIEVVRELPK